MADLEKAQQALDYLSHAIQYGEPSADLQCRVHDVRRALDGDVAEEWEANRSPITGLWRVWRIGHTTELASGMDEGTARRISRLPALERAAAAAEKYLDRWAVDNGEHGKIIADLAAALNQEDKP